MFWSIAWCLPLLMLLTVVTVTVLLFGTPTANTRRGLRLNAFNQTRDRQTDRQIDRQKDRHS